MIIKHCMPLASALKYLAHRSQSKSGKISYVSRVTEADWKQTWTKLTLINDFYSDMFPLDFDCLFQPLS